MLSFVTRQVITKLGRNYSVNYRAFATTSMAPIRIGDALPAGELFEDSPANKIDLSDICCGKRVIIFGVPGAFTPGCSKTHLPGYVEAADDLKKEKCVSEIICVSVNDPFVMAAWGIDQGTCGRVRMLADPLASFARALGLTVDLPPLGGIRFKRFSMIVDNSRVCELNVEPDGTGLSCSLANNLRS